MQKVQTDHPDKTLRVGIKVPYLMTSIQRVCMDSFFTQMKLSCLRKVDTVYLSPNQVKSHASAFLNRPKGWKMGKGDMVDAVKQATEGQGAKRWNHHQADAYWVGRTAGRFWQLIEGTIEVSDLSELENKTFYSL